MYAKVFASLWDGSMAGKTDVQLVFIFLLARSDPEGQVNVTPQVIGFLTGMGEQRAATALLELEATDPNSRSPEEDGRRIARLDEHRAWGWKIVNHGRYREMRNETDRRFQNREAKRRQRAPASVSNGQHASAMSAKAEAEAEAEKESKHLSQAAPARAVRSQASKDWEEAFTEHVWPLRPRRGAPGPAAGESKPAALKAWMKHLPKDQSPTGLAEAMNRICDGLERDRAQYRAANTEASKIPHLSTYLNQQYWLDSENAVDAPPSPDRASVGVLTLVDP